MASFGGATFGLLPNSSGRIFARWIRESDSSVVHIPGGNVNVIQSSGLNADKLTIIARCTEAQLEALYGKVNTVGLLDVEWGTRTAYLDKIPSAEEQIADSDLFFVSLVFIGQ